MTDNLDTLDPVSIAGAVAHAGAARLCGLIADPDYLPVACWFEPSAAYDQHHVDQLVDRLGEFVAARKEKNGEAIYLWAIDQKLVGRQAKSFAALPYASRAAWTMFGILAHETLWRLLLEVSLRDEAGKASLPPEPPIARKDSIEGAETPGLETEVEWAKETRELMAQGVAFPNLQSALQQAVADVAASTETPAQGAAALRLGETLPKPPGPAQGGRPKATNAIKQGRRRK